MNIALIGYGKMGKEIEKIAISRGHIIIGKSNSKNPITDLDFSKIDVAIEFTLPNLAKKHIKYCTDKRVPIVVGTTAWYHDFTEVNNYVKKNNGTLLYASNFSIGVNIFFNINKRLAKLTSNNGYKASIQETHHLEKIDAPSGTAISLVKDIILENKNYNSWEHQENRRPNVLEDEIAVTSFRKENIPGTHQVSYESDIEIIEIKHTAKNRKGFALGAIIAAEWILNKKGSFTMQDIITL